MLSLNETGTLPIMECIQVVEAVVRRPGLRPPVGLYPNAAADPLLTWARPTDRNSATHSLASLGGELVVYDRGEPIAAIAALGALHPNWDGHQGVAPTERAREQAAAFILHIPSSTPNPEIEASGDGEINLVWRRTDGGYLEVGFYGGETFSYYGRPSEDDAPSLDDVPIAENRLPSGLRSLLDLLGYDVRVRA